MQKKADVHSQKEQLLSKRIGVPFIIFFGGQLINLRLQDSNLKLFNYLQGYYFLTQTRQKANKESGINPTHWRYTLLLKEAIHSLLLKT